VASFVDALLESTKNYVVIYPNNDIGTKEILSEYKRLENNKRFRIFPSLRFEYFLRLLKESDFIIGNSSAGIREAPYYNIPAVNVGSRQNNRSRAVTIHSVLHSCEDILNAIKKCEQEKEHVVDMSEFGTGNSDALFLNLLMSQTIWDVDCQKQFQDL
jgi:UDP-N-acetylglucosamine 2-epimerase (hydrolysing)